MTRTLSEIAEAIAAITARDLLEAVAVVAIVVAVAVICIAIAPDLARPV
jgi:hypothetical protein